MGQVGKQTLRAHQAGGRKRWSVLRPQGAHLQPRPAGGGSRHSCPHQCSQQSPPRGHQHPGAAARGTGKTGRWEKSNSEGQNSQGCVLERRTGGFRVRRACTPRARLESTTSFFLISFMVMAVQLESPTSKGLCNRSRKSILAPCCAQAAGFPQGISPGGFIPRRACARRSGSCRGLSRRTCFH